MMILTLVFSILIFASLWPYFIALDVINFRKAENTLENHLPGRPARRTIGRKNSDVIKGIIAIFVCYIILSGTFYGLPYFRGFLGDTFLFIVVVGLSAYAFYIVTPSNRALHAYATAGQIAVIHMCSSVSSYTILSVFLHGNVWMVNQMMAISAMVLGIMFIFSRKQRRG